MEEYMYQLTDHSPSTKEKIDFLGEIKSKSMEKYNQMLMDPSRSTPSPNVDGDDAAPART
jgi:hypothetical protein